MASDNTHHLNYLDGIRAIAAICVMAGHTAHAAGWASSLILRIPALAVDIFMMLSGYLMVYQAMQRKAENDFAGFTKAFYVRRFFRIAPLYYLLLLCCYLFRNLYLHWITQALSQLNTDFIQGALVNATKTTLSADHILSHLSFLYGFSPTLNTSTLLPDWTLTLEMQFYVVFPLVFLWFYRRSPFLPTLILLLVSAGIYQLLVPRYFDYFATVLPLKLGLFMGGMLLAWAKWGSNRSIQILCVALAFLCLRGNTQIICACIMLLCDHAADFPQVPYLLKTASLLRTALGCGVARFFADISYGIYLTHSLVLIPLVCFYCRFTWFLEYNPIHRFLILVLPVAALVTLISTLLHYGVERPAIWIGKRLTARSSAADLREIVSKR